ncbi:MAG: SEC-C metal-binding domain-containing protein [Planctomycetota bacterium]
MDTELLRLAAAPTTRSLMRELAERLGDADPRTLAELARADGELRAAVNFALSGAISGRPPTGSLAAGLFPSIENTDVAIALLGTVRHGLVEALIESAKLGWHTADRQGLVLWLAATHLDGREPPDELKTRIRLTSRHELAGSAAIFVGLAAMAIDDPDVTEVARDCVAAADSAAGRDLERRLRGLLDRPLIDVIPETAPDIYGGFTVKRAAPRVGRNEPCPCGSGKKYKRCCLDRTAETAPTANPGQPWGERARRHRAMTDEQFEKLLPVELARIPPAELPTPRLLATIEKLCELSASAMALPLVDEAVGRNDLPEGTTPLTIRETVLQSATARRHTDVVDRVLEGIDEVEEIREDLRIALAVLRREPDALDRIEAMADRALRENDKDVLSRFLGVLLFFEPALGILLCRGNFDVDDPVGMEESLGQIEEVRDILLLPPHDPLWEIYDAVSERMLESRAERSALEENEELEAEAEELRRDLAIAREREREAHRTVDRLVRKVDGLAARVVAEKERSRDAAEHVEALEDARRELRGAHVRIAQGNEKRRQLRARVRRFGAARAAEPPADDEDDREVEPEAVPERWTPRIPTFAKEFRDGLSDVEGRVARAATAMACLLAAADAGAWSGVKSIKAFAGVFSRRIGHHRILFRLDGEDGIELMRVIHRRDLETVIRRMGG